MQHQICPFFNLSLTKHGFGNFFIDVKRNSNFGFVVDPVLLDPSIVLFRNTSPEGGEMGRTLHRVLLGCIFDKIPQCSTNVTKVTHALFFFQMELFPGKQNVIKQGIAFAWFGIHHGNPLVWNDCPNITAAAFENFVRVLHSFVPNHKCCNTTTLVGNVFFNFASTLHSGVLFCSGRHVTRFRVMVVVLCFVVGFPGFFVQLFIYFL